VGGDSEDVDLAGGVFDDEERIEPGQGDGVDAEQVAGQVPAHDRRGCHEHAEPTVAVW
jgi:hypothetical protein